MQTTFATSSIYLAGFLKCRGMDFVGIQRTAQEPARFVFRERDDRSALSDAFLHGREDQVGAREYMRTIRELKSLLYDG